jgi:hypothetical protein
MTDLMIPNTGSTLDACLQASISNPQLRVVW